MSDNESFRDECKFHPQVFLIMSFCWKILISSWENHELKTLPRKQTLVWKCSRGSVTVSGEIENQRNITVDELKVSTVSLKPMYTRPPLSATSLQRPLCLVDIPYIGSCLNLSTKATCFCPKGDRCGEVRLFIIYILRNTHQKAMS